MESAREANCGDKSTDHVGLLYYKFSSGAYVCTWVKCSYGTRVPGGISTLHLEIIYECPQTYIA